MSIVLLCIGTMFYGYSIRNTSDLPLLRTTRLIVSKTTLSFKLEPIRNTHSQNLVEIGRVVSEISVYEHDCVIVIFVY